MGKLATHTAGSRLAIVLTTVIVTTVVLVGGVALATVGLNSVGSDEIINNSIRSQDIKDGTVTSTDLRNNDIRGSDIRDGTVTSADILNMTIKGADLAPSAKPAGVNFAGGDQSLDLDGSVQSVRSVVLDAPAAGHVILTASGYVQLTSAAYDLVVCSITDGAIAIDESNLMLADDGGVVQSLETFPLSGTRTFAVSAGPTTFHLVCLEVDGDVAIFDSQITALYVPALYAP